jgi:hypothetical protein
MRRDISSKDKKIKEVKDLFTDGKEYKISQFADETSLLLDGSENFLDTA